MVNTIKGKKGKREEERVENPLLGFHGHIQPARWHRLIRPDDALGGVYNRILPVLVERQKNLPTGMSNPLSNVKESAALTRAYKWARAEPRVMQFSAAAAERHDNYRAELEDQLDELPETLSCLIERADEHVLRIACVLTAAERKAVVGVKAWEAARAFVDYSMASVRRLASEAETVGRRPAKPLPDVIRETLQRYGGEATSSVLLRAIGARANAAGIKAAVAEMDDVEMEVERTGQRGGPKINYRLVGPKPVEVGQPEPAPLPLVEVAVEPKRELATAAVERSEPVVVRVIESVIEPKPVKTKKVKKKAGKSKKAVASKPRLSVVAGSPEPGRPETKPTAARKASPKPPAPAQTLANPFLALL